MDFDDVMSRFAGDGEFLLRSLEIFRDSYPEQLAQIRSFFAENDFARAERAAHALKGSGANFGGTAAAKAALCLETLAREKDSRDWLTTCDRLQFEIEHLVGAVSSFAHGLDTGKGSTSENIASGR
jgi:HPt (histidine-containing phosphotransfer) domain-containing protein